MALVVFLTKSGRADILPRADIDRDNLQTVYVQYRTAHNLTVASKALYVYTCTNTNTRAFKSNVKSVLRYDAKLENVILQMYIYPSLIRIFGH